MSHCDFEPLDRVGLNLQAVFDVDGLPETLRTRLRELAGGARQYRQLILIGNAGPKLWESVMAAQSRSKDPIDEFSVRTVSDWFATRFGDTARLDLYPGDAPLDLQGLGSLAGWHHASPFKVGINNEWGSWFAYRVAFLADTTLPPTGARFTTSPCTDCVARYCVAACPAEALADNDFDLPRCIAYRQLPDSLCAHTCVARISCPVRSEFRYHDDQIRHGYGNSLRMIALHAAKE